MSIQPADQWYTDDELFGVSLWRLRPSGPSE
jgi:hypothetical protein